MDFLFLIISYVILPKNKDYAYIMPTYVLSPTSCVDFSWNIVVYWQYFKDKLYTSTNRSQLLKNKTIDSFICYLNFLL
jgi:hypothetical protein